MPDHDVDILARARAQQDALVTFARRLIQTPSLPGEEGAVAALMQEEMRRLGYDEVRSDEVGNVIGLVRGRAAGRSVMLNTHLDHVSPGDPSLWTDDPYAASVRDGAIYGSAAVDIKGPLACQVYGGALLLADGLRPAGDVYVAGVVYEECGGIGTRHLARTLPTDSAVIGEPSSNTLRRGHRGRLGIIVEVRGRAAHASVPDRAVNPHHVMAAFLLRMRDLPMRQQEPFGASSCAPTLYSTDNTSSNVIPSTARLFVDWRNVPAESPEEAVATLQSVLDECLIAGSTGIVRLDMEYLHTYTGLEETVPSVAEAFVLEEDNPVVATARAALESLLGRPFPPDIWRFATDGGRLMAQNIPVVGFGPGDETQAHVADEHIAIAEMVEAVAANAALARALSAMPAG